MHLFAPCNPASACQYHRTLLPFRHLPADYPQHRWETGLTDPSGDFDVLWMYGGLSASNLPEIARLKRRGVKLVYGLDDTFWTWPAWRHDPPTKEVVGTVNLMVELADLIVASTPALATEIGKPTKTVVAPNLLEVGRYKLPTPAEEDGPLRIMWSGAASHKGDLDLIDEACCRVKQEWGERVHFYCIGAGPDRLLRDWWGDGVFLVDWFPLSEYWFRLHQVRPHITLAPLVDCPFNRCKSSIRLLEAGAMNSAVVASPVGEYRLTDGVDGYYATTTDEWVDRINRLLSDRLLREQTATAAYTRVVAEWNWTNPNSRLKWRPVVDALEKL